MEVARRVYLPDVVASYIARLVDATHAGGPAKGSSGDGQPARKWAKARAALIAFSCIPRAPRSRGA